MNAHFAAAVPNLHIMGAGVDRVPREGEHFTHAPELADGHLEVPDRQRWRTEPVEAAVRARPPKAAGGLVQHKRT